MTLPWQAPVPGQATLVGHANQFLVAHPSTLTYQGITFYGTASAAGGVADQLGAGVISWKFVAPSTLAMTYITVAMGAIGAGADVYVSVQGDSAGLPNGTPIASAIIPAEWLPSGVQTTLDAFAVPLPCSLTSGTTYHIVFAPAVGLVINNTAEWAQLASGVNDVEITRNAAYGTGVTWNPVTGVWSTQAYGYAVQPYYTNQQGRLIAISEDPITSRVSTTWTGSGSFPIPTRLSSYGFAASGFPSSAYIWAARSWGATPNMLCRDDASLEVGLGTWVATTNCAVARSNTVALDGSWSLRMTSSAAGSMTATTSSGSFPSTYYSVIAAQTYTAAAQFSQAVSLRNVSVAINWYTLGGAFISTSTGAVVAESGTGGFVQAFVTAAAPGTAAYATVSVIVAATGAASEVHYVDEIGLFPGSNIVWNYPGVGISTKRTLTYSNTVYSGITLTGAQLLTGVA